MDKREFVLRKANQSRDVAHGKQVQRQKTEKIAPQKKTSSHSKTTRDAQNSFEGYDYRKLRRYGSHTKCGCGFPVMHQSNYCFYCDPK